MDWTAVSSGFGVGAMVGLTGVGAGSLMTPLLLSVFKLSPATAIGTDLWFAAITKSAGAASHHRAGHVNWRVAGLLLAGSLPASAATIALMHATGVKSGWSSALTLALGIALLLTAVTVAYRHAWQAVGLGLERWTTPGRKQWLTVCAGLALSVMVSLCSVGAGAIGATLILLLNPRLDARQVVGTDIAHALPLTLVAGIGHFSLGHVDWQLLGSLLVGSIPGIWLGSQWSRRLPEKLIRSLLCLALLGAGLKVIS